MSNTSVGQVVGGAAMAAGGVMLCGAAFGGTDFNGIGQAISNFFSKSGGGLQGFITAAGNNPAITGAALLGGGAVLTASMSPQGQDALPEMPEPVAGGFAEQIAFDRAMMRMRSAMAQQSPELCAACAGRG